MEQTPGSSRILASQLLRSGTSIGANLEEAYGSHSRADFIAKLVIAAKEARETHYWIRLLTETNMLKRSETREHEDEANQIVSILTAIIIRTRANSKQ
jgi:four helix bundle protein